MVLNIYSIFDKKAGIYNMPFYQSNDAVARRTAVIMRNDKTTPAYTNPEDYTLFHIGHFDADTGKLSVLDTPMPIVSFHEIQLALEV